MSEGAIGYHGLPSKRGSGGKFARVAPPDTSAAAAKPETAQQVFDRLQETREQNNGYLVPPPAISAPRLVRDSGINDGPNADWKAATAWLGSLPDAQASPDDVERAGQFLLGFLPDGDPARYIMRENIERVKDQAGPAWFALHKRAEAEDMPRRILVSLRADLRLAEEKLEAETRRYLRPLQEQVSRLKAAIAKAEAELS